MTEWRSRYCFWTVISTRQFFWRPSGSSEPSGFLFGAALNALAALSRIAPRKVPLAAGRLRQFLRASFEQQERLLVPLEEELAVVRAYLDIESLRFGDRLKVEEAIDPRSLSALMPPFSFQPLVENAVQHGIQASPRTGQLQLVVRPTGSWLELSVSVFAPSCG